MHERIRSISHQNKQILEVDLANCSAHEVEKICRMVPDHVTIQPRNSVRILVDFTGASFDKEAIRTMKETSVFDKPYIKKSAWIGARSLPPEFFEEIQGFSRREFPTFSTRQQALTWLVED